MANVKVTDLPAAVLPLTGAEIVMVDQTGQSRQVTVGDIAPTAMAQYLVLTADGVLAEERVFTPDLTQFVVADGGPGGAYSVGINPAFYSGLADPTSQVGLVTVPGVAFTAMRSDAAPALDQGIAPTWTGQHQWALSLWAPDGLVGTPGYTFTSDPDTGLYHVGADALGVASGGALRLTVQNANVTATVPYWAPDGSAAAPAYAFASGGTSGLYKIGVGNIGLSTSGVLRWDVSTTAITSTLQRLGADGAVGAPQYSYSGDPDTGTYRIGANNLGIATGGVLAVDVRSNQQVVFSASVFVPDGTAGTPAYNFTNDTNTGIYRVGADQVGVSAGGTVRLTVSTTDTRASGTLGAGDTTIPTIAAGDLYSAISAGTPSLWLYEGDAVADEKLWRLAGAGSDLTLTVRNDANNAGADVFRVVRTGIVVDSFQIAASQTLLGDGAVGTPALAFTADTNTGIYRAAADNMALVAGGTTRLAVASTGIFSNSVPIFTLDGTAADPSISYVNDTNTGFYRSGADVIGFSTGGTSRGVLSTAALQMSVLIGAADGAAATPGFYFTSDNNTGLYSGGADVLGIATAGTARGTVSSAGVWTISAATGARTMGVSAPDNQYAIGAIGSTTLNQSFGLIIDAGTGTSDIAFRVRDSTTTHLFFIRGDGQCQAHASTDAAVPIYSFNGDNDTGMFRYGTNSIGFSVNGALAARFISTGQLLGTDGSATNPGFSFDADSNVGMYRNGTDTLSLATAGSERFRIGSGGATYFPGVGTTASAANAFLDSGSSPVNQLLRSTSSIRFKQDVQDIDPVKVDVLTKLRPITYRSTCQADDQSVRWYGFIAEEVAAVEPRLVTWGRDPLNPDSGLVPDGVQYERLTVLMAAYIQKLEARVKVLEKKVLH